jgi:hypothetical protein
MNYSIIPDADASNKSIDRCLLPAFIILKQAYKHGKHIGNKRIYKLDLETTANALLDAHTK